MRFRGLIAESNAMRDFLNIATSLSKLAKECVMRIVKKKVYFIISSEEAGPKRPFVWCELPVAFYFKEYNLSGLNEVYDEIYLQLDCSMLAKSLATVKQNAKTLKIKLTKKDTPCLTVEIEQLTLEGSRQCIHDIPVEIILREHWSDYEEPVFTEFHVSIQMPSLKSVKSIVEKMKSMSHELIVSANKDGRLTYQIKSNIVTIAAHFPDLNVKSFAVGQLATIDDDWDKDAELVSTTIEIKKFLMFLNAMHVSNYQTTCSIVHGNMLKLYLEQPGALILQCFLTQVAD